MAESLPVDPAAAYALRIWEEYVRATPSVFGRLAFLASLRDPATGRYRHVRLSPLLGAETADRFLRDRHRATFAEWLTFNLQQQSSDFECFLSGTKGYKRQNLLMFTVIIPRAWYAPEEAAEHELRLFLADFEAILTPLQAEYGIAASPSAPGPGAKKLSEFGAI